MSEARPAQVPGHVPKARFAWTVRQSALSGLSRVRLRLPAGRRRRSPGARPIDETRDLGIMLFDLDFADPRSGRDRSSSGPHSVTASSHVPRRDSSEVLS